MTKLAAAILIAIFTIGIGAYIFVGNQSVKQKTVDGHNRVKSIVRSWDYVSN